MMGPEPMRRMDLRSVRLGMAGRGEAEVQPLFIKPDERGATNFL
jgi:hypothetical protein